jgi:hypothetical protein
MNTKDVKRRTTSLRLTSDFYAHIEKLAKRENRSINNYIETILSKATDFKIPNEETREAIAELERDKVTLKRYSGANDLFEDLEK